MLIQACSHYQNFVDHSAWAKAQAEPTLTHYTCTDCTMISDNWKPDLPPATKELTQPQPNQSKYQWSANQQGIKNFDQIEEDNQWDPFQLGQQL